MLGLFLQRFLGALFHDKISKDITPKINDYFDSEISSYLITGGLFGAIGTLGSGIFVQDSMGFYLTQPWIYSMSIMQGFLIGTTAMAGAYFGDETIKTHEEINDDYLLTTVNYN